LLHLVGSSILLYLIDDARTNKNQEFLLFALVGRLIEGFANNSTCYHLPSYHCDSPFGRLLMIHPGDSQHRSIHEPKK